MLFMFYRYIIQLKYNSLKLFLYFHLVVKNSHSDLSKQFFYVYIVLYEEQYYSLY